MSNCSKIIWNSTLFSFLYFCLLLQSTYQNTIKEKEFLLRKNEKNFRLNKKVKFEWTKSNQICENALKLFPEDIVPKLPAIRSRQYLVLKYKVSQKVTPEIKEFIRGNQIKVRMGLKVHGKFLLKSEENLFYWII
ncbi:hypothetical protein BpHYR1_001040 [Brachionus plicatilis]|uniref:Uncharacterized protein n=1 Tax=Brachionus plicatilis TaxID=10195 RepID=A0A3M7QD25_BRAPC|nr:hypothetical protein BpHYR1_001040 [Brachionus plicatilis]